MAAEGRGNENSKQASKVMRTVRMTGREAKQRKIVKVYYNQSREQVRHKDGLKEHHKPSHSRRREGPFEGVKGGEYFVKSKNKQRRTF